MTALLLAAILIRIDYGATVVECETTEPVVYAPDARMVLVECDDRVFSDSFEG